MSRNNQPANRSVAEPLNQSVHMICDRLRTIPRHALPAGYHFRAYRAGDDQNWLAVQRAAEPFIAITDDFFEREYGQHRDVLADRMFFVETTEGLVMATISAWWERDRHSPAQGGRIHWVAVHPDFQGRGISKPMMTLAMQRLAQEYTYAVLGTSSGRPRAIKVYLDFGFLPLSQELNEPATRQAWESVQQLLHHPRLATALAR